MKRSLMIITALLLTLWGALEAKKRFFDVVVTVPTLTDVCLTGTYKPLGDIVISESNNNDFSASTSGQFLIMKVVGNFELQPNVGTVALTNTGGNDLNNVSIITSTKNIIIFYDATIPINLDELTISGLKIKATGGVAGVGSIQKLSGAAILGITDNATNLATFTSIAPPTVSLISSDADNTICEGESVTFTASGADTYSFYVNGILKYSASDTYTTTLLKNNDVVTVIGATATGCAGTSATSFTMTVNSLPIVSITSSDSDNIICSGQSVTFTGTGNATTYKFYKNGAEITTATNPYTTSVLSDGDLIKVEGIKDGCSVFSNELAISILPTTIDFTPPLITGYEVTETTPVPLSDYATFGGSVAGDYTYATTVGAGATYSGPGVVLQGNDYFFYPNLAGVGSHTITFSTGGGCGSSATIGLDVYAVSIADLSKKYCVSEISAPALATYLMPSPISFPDNLVRKIPSKPKNVNLVRPAAVKNDPEPNTNFATKFANGFSMQAYLIDGITPTNAVYIDGAGFKIHPNAEIPEGSTQIVKVKVKYNCTSSNGDCDQFGASDPSNYNTATNTYYIVQYVKVLCEPLPLPNIKNVQDVCGNSNALQLLPFDNTKAIIIDSPDIKWLLSTSATGIYEEYSNTTASSTSVFYQSQLFPNNLTGQTINATVIPADKSVELFMKIKYTTSCESDVATQTPKSFWLRPKPVPTFGSLDFLASYCKGSETSKNVAFTTSNGLGEVDVPSFDKFYVLKNTANVALPLSTSDIVKEFSNGQVSLDFSTLNTGSYKLMYRYGTQYGCEALSTPKNFNITDVNITYSGVLAGAGFCANDGVVRSLQGKDGSNNVSGIFEITKQGSGIYTTLLGDNFTPSDYEASPGTYEIRFTYEPNTACKIYASKTISINALPTVDFIIANGYCLNITNAVLKPLVNNINPIDSVNGTFAYKKIKDGLGNAVVDSWHDLSPPAGKNTFNPNALGVGEYQMKYSYSDAFGCGQTTAPKNFLIYLAPPVTSIANSTPCFRVPINFTAVGGIAGDNYTWNFGDGSSSTQQNPTYTYAGTGNFNVTLTVSNSTSCSVFYSKLINVPLSPNLNVQFTEADQSFCKNKNVLLTPLVNGLAPSVGKTVNWYIRRKLPTPTANFELISNIAGTYLSQFNSIRPLPSQTTDDDKYTKFVYEIRYVYIDGGCTNETITEVTIDPNPKLDYLFPVTVTGKEIKDYCSSEPSISLQQSVFGGVIDENKGNFRIKKILPAGGTFDLPSGANNNKVVLSDSRYGIGMDSLYKYGIKYLYQNENSCQDSSSVDTLVVRRLPIVSGMLITDTCYTDVTRFEALSPEVNNLRFEWDFGDGNKDTGRVVYHKYSVVQDYTVTLNAKMASRVEFNAKKQDRCPTIKTRNIKIYPYPVPEFEYLGSCISGGGVTTQFTDKSTVSLGTVTNWYWEFFAPDGTTLLGTSTNQNPTFIFANPGQHKVRLTVRGSNLSCPKSITKNVNIFPSITISLTNFYQENFDVDNGKWIADGVNSSWEHGNIVGGRKMNTLGKAWKTKLKKTPTDSTYNDLENSYIESPCFDITNFDKPTVNVKYWVDTEGNDGGTLIYTIDDGRTWEQLGDLNQGTDWFYALIASRPNGFIKGWSTLQQTDWITAKFPLDKVKGDMIATGSTRVRFRIAFASDATHIAKSDADGFALKYFGIINRNRLVLLEHFTNTNYNAAPTEDLELDRTDYYEAQDIQYHINLPTPDQINLDNTADPSAKALLYGVSNVTQTYLDGKTQAGQLASWGVTKYTSRTLDQSPFSIELNFPPSTTNLNVSVNVRALEAVVDYDPTKRKNLTMHVAVLEKEIDGTKVGASGRVLKNVVKKLLPDAAGTRVERNWVSGDQMTFNQVWEPIKIYDPTKLAVVAWLQDANTNEVFQAVYKEVTTPPVISAIGDDEFTKEIYLFPNPAENKANITLSGNIQEKVTFIIYDNIGKLIEKGEISGVDRKAELNLQSYTEGMYLVQFIGKNGKIGYKKLIIKR